jgi:hypothetical protein
MTVDGGQVKLMAILKTSNDQWGEGYRMLISLGKGRGSRATIFFLKNESPCPVLEGDYPMRMLT